MPFLLQADTVRVPFGHRPLPNGPLGRQFCSSSTLPIITPSQQESSFMYMDSHAQLSWCKDPTQLAHDAAYRVHPLRRKADRLEHRIDPNRTEVLYIPPRGAGSKRHKANPKRLALHSENLTASPRNSIKWLGVVQDTKLFPGPGRRQSCNHRVYTRPN